MNPRTLVASAALVAATLVPSLSYASPEAQAPCIFGEHRVVSVEPLQVDRQSGRFTVKEVRGAQIYMQAEPGLTAEWLQLTLERHLGAMNGSALMPDCALGLNKVQVGVSSAGAGFWVRVAGPDAKTGEEILRRARLLVQ